MQNYIDIMLDNDERINLPPLSTRPETFHIESVKKGELRFTGDVEEKPKTCGNCKYWTPLPLDRRYGTCEHEKVDTELIGSECDELLIYDGGEGYNFETGKNFGCIHFEEKE